MIQFESALTIENKVLKQIADLSSKNGLPEGDYRWALELCSDSRVPSLPFNFDGKARVKYNAGNQGDMFDVLHPTIDTYVLIGHSQRSQQAAAL